MLLHLPREILFYILLQYEDYKELNKLGEVSKEMNSLSMDEVLWKQLYVRKWLHSASVEHLKHYYVSDFKWREMFKLRVIVEWKYLTKDFSDAATPAEEWKCFLRKGKMLAKYETEDVNEFIALATVQQEEYVSAAVHVHTSGDKAPSAAAARQIYTQYLLETRINPTLADLYYYWGRCIKDLSRFKQGKDKHKLLLMEEEKYKIAHELSPNDSYILYCWGINLRFQLDCNEGAQAVAKYREASKKYRQAYNQGYLEKYVVWGLGSLKLNMAKKQILEGNWDDVKKYLDKAEKKFSRLSSHLGDTLTTFANLFNFACILQCRSLLARVNRNYEESRLLFIECKKRLQDCGSKNEYLEYLTTDLLDLWYWKDLQNEEWFCELRSKSKPKKLNSPW